MQAPGLSGKPAAVSETDRRAWQANPQTSLHANSQRGLSLLGTTQEGDEDREQSGKWEGKASSPGVHSKETSPRLALEAISTRLESF